MKKVVSLATATSIYLSSAFNAFAQINIIPTSPGGPNNAATNLGSVINNVIQIVFIVATLVVLFFLMMGAFNWITSGGDKEKIASARKMIVNALIGLAILALSFLILNVVASVLNIQVGGSLPKL